jgi:hypothetical protein
MPFMLDAPPQSAKDDDAKEIASKQHSMWIVKLPDSSWADNITTDIRAFEEESRCDGILQQLTKEKI